MNKCDNPVYKKVTRRGKMCDVCSVRSRGVQQECQTCTMTTCRKCYNRGNFDQYHDLSLAENLDWSTNIDPADEVEPRRGPIVRRINPDGSWSSPQTHSKAVDSKPPYKPGRSNHPDAHKKEYGHKELYQTTSKSKQNVSAPEDSKRKNQSAGEQQPAKKKPKRQDYQLYQTTFQSKKDTPSKGMNYHKELYQTGGEQTTGEQHADNERIGGHQTGDQRAGLAHGTGFNHQTGYPPVDPPFPRMHQNMVYDPRTGQYYPHQPHGFDYGHHGMGIPHPQQHHSLDYGHQGMQQFYPQEQQSFAHDGRLPTLRPLPTHPLAHYPTARPQDGFRGPEHVQAAQMPSQRDYYAQQAYHHQMGFQHPSEPHNMLYNPQMGSYSSQYPQHLGFGIPQAGYGHPQAGAHGPQQPRTLTPHDPGMPGLQEANEQQSGRQTAVSQPQEDLGIPETQQGPEIQREQNDPLPGTPHGSTPESLVRNMPATLQDTDDDFPPVRPRQQQQYQSSRTQPDEDSLFVPEAVHGPHGMNMRMPLQDTDDDFPPLKSRQQHKPAQIQSDEDSLFVPQAVSESTSDRDSLSGQTNESAHEVSVIRGPEIVQQRAAQHEHEQLNANQRAPEGPGADQVSDAERQVLIANLERTWTGSSELARIRSNRDVLRGALDAMQVLRGSILVGTFGERDAIKAIACAWVDSLSRTYRTDPRF